MLCARSVLLILFLLAGSSSPPLHAQESAQSPESSRGFYLEQNYPNPVNPETFIPFLLEEELFADRDTAVVTIRIFNVLRQVVAVPEAIDHPQGEEVPVIELSYAEAGRKLAYWDGMDTSGRRAPSGVYYCQLVVNDQPQLRKLIVLNPERRRGFPWFGTGEDESFWDIFDFLPWIGS
ncbi:MAG TPA: hypothetical protein VFI91_13785 [Longimicrobiaceae bacterium]|nr:hypothetical protein [Longimicrobiaceae bacterium]